MEDVVIAPHVSACNSHWTQRLKTALVGAGHICVALLSSTGHWVFSSSKLTVVRCLVRVRSLLQNNTSNDEDGLGRRNVSDS